MHRAKLALLVYACADAGIAIEADSIRCVLEGYLRWVPPWHCCSGPVLAERHPHTRPNRQLLGICRQAFGVTLADATIWQAALWLDDAARGEEAAESLERACLALPGAPAPATPQCVLNIAYLWSLTEPDAAPCTFGAHPAERSALCSASAGCLRHWRHADMRCWTTTRLAALSRGRVASKHRRLQRTCTSDAACAGVFTRCGGAADAISGGGGAGGAGRARRGAGGAAVPGRPARRPGPGAGAAGCAAGGGAAHGRGDPGAAAQPPLLHTAATAAAACPPCAPARLASWLLAAACAVDMPSAAKWSAPMLHGSQPHSEGCMLAVLSAHACIAAEAFDMLCRCSAFWSRQLAGQEAGRQPAKCWRSSWRSGGRTTARCRRCRSCLCHRRWSTPCWAGWCACPTSAACWQRAAWWAWWTCLSMLSHAAFGNHPAMEKDSFTACDMYPEPTHPLHPCRHGRLWQAASQARSCRCFWCSAARLQPAWRPARRWTRHWRRVRLRVPLPGDAAEMT